MYNDNIFSNNNHRQNNRLKHSYSNNYLLEHQRIFSSSKFNDSTHSLPILLEEKITFTQFLAEEKYNLQFFRSFKQTRKINNQEKETKKLIRNFHALPFNISTKYYSALNKSKIYDIKRTLTCLTHPTNFAQSVLSYISGEKSTEPVIEFISHKKMDTIDISRKKHVHCVERHISYMNNEQTKAAFCFILQLNSYFNQKRLPLQKESNRINGQVKKLDVLPEKLIKFNTNSTSTVNVLSKSDFKDTYLEETNDSIDISMELFDNSDPSLKLISNKNDHSITFYNRTMINNSPSLLKKETKIENQQVSVSTINDRQETITENEDKIVDCRCDINIHHEMNTNIPTTDLSTKSSQRIQTSIKSITEINGHQQSTMLNNSNYQISASSNLLNKSHEKKSSLSLHSSSLVSFEVANREEHIVEMIEFPRSSHRISRMDVYKQIHERLVFNTLIDIDLTGLLRTISQAFS